jgi:prepilin-type N-terminal cleavage/methylation domain-containing protein
MLSRTAVWLRARIRSARADAGFTLVELLVVIAILGVITVPIGNVVLGLMRNTDDTSHRLTESHDVQITAAYWSADVGELGTRNTLDPLNPTLRQSVEKGVPYNGPLYPCGPSGTPSAAVRFASDDVAFASGGSTTRLVVTAYVAVSSGSRFELRRLRCVNNVLQSNIVVAHNLLTAPTVLCDGGNDCSGSGAATPRTVTLALKIQDPGSAGPSYDATLSGQRRQE